MDKGLARVAVVGAGPSGLYTALALQEVASVDVIERLGAPYGLVRYGVAPDHMKMKSVTRVLRTPFESGAARFVGNVTVGRDIRLEELREHYHAIVYATGSPLGRSLGIAGEELLGSYCSTEVVGWYGGHPDQAGLDLRLQESDVVVVGAGNVALDVVRILAKAPEELRATDVPDRVLGALTASRVRDIHLLVRRGPRDVKFTPVELRQIGDLGNASVVVHDDGVLQANADSGGERRQQQNMAHFREWAARPTESGKLRRIHLRFLRSPVQIEGDGGVCTVLTEQNAVAGDRIVPTGRRERIAAGMVVRAIGYEAEPIAGLPYDRSTGTIPNKCGRVVDDGEVMSGVYVAGWAKRGPTGVIGTNKGDAAETASAVAEDLPELRSPRYPDREHLSTLLRNRGVRLVTWSDWLRLDAEERRLGAARGAERVKVVGQSHS